MPKNRTPTEAERARRYAAVRSVSRGGDIGISSVIEAVFGGSWLWYLIALGTGGLFNILVDYFGQKLWVNRAKTHQPARYAVLRVYYLPVGFGAHALLYQYLKLPFLFSSIAVSVCLWIITYRNTRSIFSPKSTRWLPWPARGLVLRRQKAKRGFVR